MVSGWKNWLGQINQSEDAWAARVEELVRHRAKEFDALRADFRVGREVEYFGRRMIVAGVCSCDGARRAEVRLRYVDSDGRFQVLLLSGSEARAAVILDPSQP